MQQPTTDDGWQIPADWPVDEKMALAILAGLELASEESPAHLIDLARMYSKSITRHGGEYISSIELLASYIVALRSRGGIPPFADLVKQMQPVPFQGN